MSSAETNTKQDDMFPCKLRVNTPEFSSGYDRMVWDNSPDKFHTEDEREVYRVCEEVDLTTNTEV